MNKKTLTFGERLNILREHQEKAPVETIPLANDLGINVYKVKDWDDGIAGKIQKDEDLGGESGYAIFVNGKHSSKRRRFTIAHEIAHFILHSPLIGDGICDSALYRSNQSDAVETEANQMAADILMPLDLIIEYMNKGISNEATLSEIFNVSEQAMRIRMKLVKRAYNDKVDQNDYAERS